MAKRRATGPKRKILFERKWHKKSLIARRRRKEYLSGSKVRELVAKQLGPKLARNFGLYVADARYYCTPIEDVREILHASKVDRKIWVQERFDCDDFAHVLKAHFAEAAYKDGKRRAAHCFGVVWGLLPGPHAINWMINSDLKLRFVEPQNDRIFAPRRNDRNIYFMLV